MTFEPEASEQLAKPEDIIDLAKLGYQQELKRNFSKLRILSIAFSTTGLLPSIAASLVFALPAGPVGMVWGWLVAAGLVFLVSVAIADLGSAMPTAGGFYWWTHYFSAPAWKNPLSFLVGYSNMLGVISGVCSMDYGLALMVLSIAHMAQDTGTRFAPTASTVYLVFLIGVLSHATVLTLVSKVVPKLQVPFLFANLILITTTIVILPVGKKHTNSAKYIFTTSADFTDWPPAWNFIMAWMCPVWTIGGFESCIHLSEEVKNATTTVPWGVMSTCGLSWMLGLIIMISVAASMTTDINSLLNTPLGQPFAQVYYDALGQRGAMTMMILLAVLQWFMGLNVLIAASRQSWAFSRDGAVPFSTFFRGVAKNFGYTPIRTIWGCAGVAIVLGLLSLIAKEATAAIFAMSVAGNHMAWFVPITARVIWGRDKFVPGPFHTGIFSIPIAIIASAFLLFSTITCLMPISGPKVTIKTMNYACVFTTIVWGGALLYYFIDAKKWFVGPRVTLDSAHSQLTDEQLEKVSKGALVDIDISDHHDHTHG